MGGLAQNVQKTPPGKNVPKSQGQIFQEFQECQGQISQGQRSNMSGMCGMSRSNFPRSNGKIQNENKMGKRKKRNIKFSKNLWKIIFENFVI